MAARGRALAASTSAARVTLRMRSAPPVLLALAALGVVSVLAASSVGSVPLPLSTELGIALRALGLPVQVRWSESDTAVLLQLRLPRVLGAFVVGSALGAAGALMQAVFRNPLADPYVLGASAGASLGAVAAFLVGTAWSALGFGSVPLLAFVGALGSLLLVYWLASVGGRAPVFRLLLAGVMVTSMLGAVSSFLIVFSPRLGNQLRSVFVWMLGGVALAGWQQLAVLFPLLCAGLAAAWLLARPLDALALGEESAAGLGIDVERVRLLSLACSALLTALAVAAGGLIGFVGLVVPHTLRMLIGPRHRLLIPAAALAGGPYLVLVDLLARTVAAPSEVPLGILTALLGAPFFLYLLRRSAGYAL